jgi:hydrogenase nickel incorporation protein HypA/HybF
MDEHEIANHVLEVVDEAAYRRSARRILGLHVEIGGRRVFDPDRLQSVFSDAARGTVAEGAQLVIKVLPVRHHCQNCGHDFFASGVERPCPDCSCPHTEMIGGEELRLLDMQLDDVA